MNHRLFSLLYYALITMTGAVFSSATLLAQTTEPTIKIIVDASKDGGTRWFPQQKKPFDPSKPHRGKYLADFLHKLASEVIEIAPGSTLTIDQLKGVTVVVRFNAYGPSYCLEETDAYKSYVEKGGSVLLVYGAPDKGSSDAVATALGVQFSQAAQEPFIKKCANLPLATGLKDGPFQTGSGISSFPESAIQLGMMVNGQSVFAIAKVGKGKVIYIGTIAPLLDESQPLLDRIFGEL